MILATLILAVLTSSSGCDGSLWNRTYHPQRFRVYDTCRSVTGTIRSIRYEPDGDAHIRLKLDTGQGSLLNRRNVEAQHSCLVVEPVCARTPKQVDLQPLCAGAPAVHIPRIGSHVRVRGVYVLDRSHGWNEIHAAQIESAPPPTGSAASERPEVAH